MMIALPKAKVRRKGIEPVPRIAAVISILTI
jgi:hypothetical protein